MKLLPGQWPASHVRYSVASPRPCCTQVRPPCLGDGFVHDLDLLFDPAPQVTEHADQSPNGVYPPGTKREKRRMKIKK